LAMSLNKLARHYLLTTLYQGKQTGVGSSNEFKA
jgi:hypothetical protein